MQNKPKIFVGGGSWARGEWENGKPRVLHRGLAQYFEEYGYQVIEASLARSWHQRSIVSLERHMEQHHTAGDVVFYFLADPLLDIVMPALLAARLHRNATVKNLKGFADKIKEAGGVIALLRRTQDQIYQQLNEVGKRFDTTIHCIGGNSNLNTNLFGPYQQLNPLVPSLMYMLVGHLDEHKHINDPEFVISYTWGIDYIDLSDFDADTANRIRQEVDSLQDHSRIMQELIFLSLIHI